ncbi:TetR/AcrR family transcriptional regulator [Haloactinomyces albus]|uniref:AcrR family transcriptional regulator n=1 Tax=Haloactinomyces albus TaxID=1352928 RepID=A0AAE3ZK01_9ACTN|nr:TetR/AcrR family transcriptional regulator [Haloactinomyces albus]MDR7304274.1 AcrR family transcriptional regulator [Haloactinomyces albus]
MPISTRRSRPDGRATRWAGQHERRRAEFVDAALAAIAEHGPEVSTEQIAQQAGVARTRLYKHFGSASDLQRAVSQRVTELLTEEFAPVWHPQGSPMRMITMAVETHLRWLTEHTHLYRYLLRCSPVAETTGTGSFTNIKTTLGRHLTRLFTEYLLAFELDPSPAETTAFGLVGYVESAGTRWLDNPAGISREALVEQLTGAIWTILDHVLRSGGVELDPHRSLPLPDDLTRNGCGDAARQS